MFIHKTDPRVQALGFVIAYNAGLTRHYCTDYVSDFCGSHSGAHDDEDYIGAWKGGLMEENIERYMLAVCVAILDEVRVEDTELLFDPRICIDEVMKATAKQGCHFKDDVNTISHDRAMAGLV
jgi:hypothetical protein